MPSQLLQDKDQVLYHEMQSNLAPNSGCWEERIYSALQGFPNWTKNQIAMTEIKWRKLNLIAYLWRIYTDMEIP